ncbi:MAG TPA: hypothetical protein VL944_02930 [Candidatus Acidoferrum sp.]|nr:hypothetical protein [Candidatus Acidoferrum sp.]
MATIDEFLQIDLRIGKIVEVNEIATRKPMYGLKVDLGELGTRSIVAGIKEKYTIDELLGRRVIVVANLEPKNIAGTLSEGMLLAAENNGELSLLQPDKELAEGSRVR